MKGFLAIAIGLTALLLLVGQLFAPEHPLGGGSVRASGAAMTAGAGPAAGDSAGTRFTAEGLTLERDKSGQFHVDAAVNGTSTRFLVDTGADSIALTVADAQAAGIDVNPNGFQPIVRTASGTGYGTLVQLDRLELGTTELHNIGAVVVKDLDVSLLGQSVLTRLGKVELQGDRMVLTPL